MVKVSPCFYLRCVNRTNFHEEDGGPPSFADKHLYASFWRVFFSLQICYYCNKTLVRALHLLKKQVPQT